MQLSDRIEGILGGGSDGWDVFNRARRMVADGIDVTELTIGEHDVRTHPSILEAMHGSALAGNTGYAPIPGADGLRDAIAARVSERTGAATTRDNVIVTAGAQAGLFAAHVVCCDPGDAALFVDPHYATYPGTIRGTGAVARPVPALAERGFLPLPADIAAAAPGASSLLVNSPNNPTGAIYPRETMEGIARAALDHDLWLISDEVYDTMAGAGEHVSAWSLPDARDRTLVVNSASKSFAMTGSRVGWIVGPEEAIAHLVTLSTHTTYGVPGFLQDAAAFALSRSPELEREVAAPFRRRKALVERLLAGANRIRAVPGDLAMYVMLDIRATGMSGEDFANALLDAERIAVMPGESFGRSAAGHVRVALTVADDALEDAVARLLAFAEAAADAGEARAG